MLLIFLLLVLFFFFNREQLTIRTLRQRGKNEGMQRANAGELRCFYLGRDIGYISQSYLSRQGMEL